jgi:NADPH-dependent curcumin reductase CurA
VRAGEIVLQETVIDGFAQLPQALNQLFTGQQLGKLMVRVS